MACSPRLDEIAVGTEHTNEIFILRVHRPNQEEDEEDQGPYRRQGNHKDMSRTATGVDFHRSKTLLPPSMIAKRWQPDAHAIGVFSGAACGTYDHRNIVTLDGKDSAPGGVVSKGGGASKSGGGSGGFPAHPFKPPSKGSKGSPGRARSR